MQTEERNLVALKESIEHLIDPNKQIDFLLFIKIIHKILNFEKDINDPVFSVKCGVFLHEPYIIIHYDSLKKLFSDETHFTKSMCAKYLQYINNNKILNKRQSILDQISNEDRIRSKNCKIYGSMESLESGIPFH